MPQRTVQIHIVNASGSTLKQTFNHLCGGQYTPLWLPPTTIPTGGTGQFQTESDNAILGGTEAYIKFDLITASGTRAGMIYIYWHNPFYGCTQARYATDIADVYPDCDYSKPGQSSSFDPTTSVPFSLTLSTIDQTPPGGDNIIEVAGIIVAGFATAGIGAVAEVPGAAAQVFSTTGIVDHPIVTFTVGAVPGGAPPFNSGPINLLLEPIPNPTPAQWLGNWANGATKVNITGGTTSDASGQALFSAEVHDAASPVLSFSQTFVLGGGGILQGDLWNNVQLLLKSATPDPAQQAALSQSVKDTISSAPRAQTVESKVKSQISPSIMAKSSAGPASSATSPQFVSINKSIAELTSGGLGVSYLNNGIALRIFKAMAFGQEEGLQIQYQRMSPAGEQITSQMLSPVQTIT
jgi:hypothetical protein